MHIDGYALTLLLGIGVLSYLLGYLCGQTQFPDSPHINIDLRWIDGLCGLARKATQTTECARRSVHGRKRWQKRKLRLHEILRQRRNANSQTLKLLRRPLKRPVDRALEVD